MAHTASEHTLSPTEQQFTDFLRKGDEFFNIELLFHARTCYKKAREFNIETEKVEQKLAACNKELAFERKIKLIVFSIAVIAVVAYFLI
jgi:hypothetical protein